MKLMQKKQKRNYKQYVKLKTRISGEWYDGDENDEVEGFGDEESYREEDVTQM